MSCGAWIGACLSLSQQRRTNSARVGLDEVVATSGVRIRSCRQQVGSRQAGGRGMTVSFLEGRVRERRVHIIRGRCPTNTKKTHARARVHAYGHAQGLT